MSVENQQKLAVEAITQQLPELNAAMLDAWDTMKKAEAEMEPWKKVYEAELSKWSQLHSRFMAMTQLAEYIQHPHIY